VSETSSNCWKSITPARKQVRLSSLIYNAFLSCPGNSVINEAGCRDYLVGMTLGAIHVSQVPESGWPPTPMTDFGDWCLELLSCKGLESAFLEEIGLKHETVF